MGNSKKERGNRSQNQGDGRSTWRGGSGLRGFTEARSGGGVLHWGWNFLSLKIKKW